MEQKFSSTISLILEILILIAQMLFSFVEAFFKIFLQTPEKPIKGEIVLITGTGHGMGKELALQFADLGAIIVCIDINKEHNDETVKEIIENKNTKAYGYICDVSQQDEVKSLAEKIKKEVGTVTVLVNNAGIMPCHQLFTYTSGEVNKLFGVNVFAHIWLLQSFLPDMIEKNHGHIVTLSSMAGLMGVENLVPYCASKFAVRGMMEALNEEIRTRTKGSEIKITVIYPYMVDTGLCQKPRIRFPSILSMVSPKEAAAQIILATRKNVPEQSIPGVLYHMNNVFRLFPYKTAFLFKDFLGSTLDEHDS